MFETVHVNDLVARLAIGPTDRELLHDGVDTTDRHCEPLVATYPRGLLRLAM